MKILLLSPPFKEKIIRDYFCGITTKASYFWGPTDLIVLSGVLKNNFEISVLDCIVDNVNYTDAKKKIKEINPDAIISLTSGISCKEDMQFLRNIKEEIKCKLAVIGDVAYFETLPLMKTYKFVDAVLTDFISPDIPNYFNGKEKGIKDVYYRRGEKIIFNGISNNKEFSYPTPQHELFSLKKYSMPFSISSPFTIVLTLTYGCPFKCKFCSSGQLHFRRKNIDNTIEELKYVQRLGVKDVLFRDFTFNAIRSEVIDLCEKIIKNNIDIKWCCDARVDNIDESLLKLMKRAGCYLIFFGVEAGDNESLDKTDKRINKEQIIKAFKLCKRIGIMTLGSYIIGLPHDTEESIKRTINFSREVDSDYVSFNFFVARQGSIFRKELKKELNKEQLEKLNSSSDISNICKVSKEKLKKLYNQAVYGYYFRPKIILRYLKNLKSFYQFKNMAKNALTLLKNK
jgi:radical SAM superfamily enzyme YgiQ (UPF0313 family)